MKIEDICKNDTEAGHQRALFAWAAVAAYHGFRAVEVWADTGVIRNYGDAQIPCLKWLHAIHNQGHGDAIRGGRAKAEGVRAGIPDIFLPFPTWEQPEKYEPKFFGLYIEMKKPSMKPLRETSKGGLSPEQIEFAKFAKENGYRWEVCYGWKDAAKIIQEYLS